MTAQVVRPVAICVFRHEGKILVARGHDPHRNGAYLRPLGGASSSASPARRRWPGS